MAFSINIDPRFIFPPELLRNLQELCINSGSQPKRDKNYVMYHGTTAAAALAIIMNGFRPSADGMLGRGVYVSRDQVKAARYPQGDKSHQVILKLSVNVGKVKKIGRRGHPLQKSWHEKGFDTAWVPPNSGMVLSGSEEDCIWDPKRIKVVGVVMAPPWCLSDLQKLVLVDREKLTDREKILLVMSLHSSSNHFISGNVFPQNLTINFQPVIFFPVLQ